MLPADVYTPYNDNLTQSFNRYAYVFNNPLSYTDPSGYFPVIILPAIVITAQSVAAAVAGYTALATFTAATVYFTATILSTSSAVNAALAGSIKGYGYFNDYTGTFSNDPGANSFLIRGNQAGVQYPLPPDVTSIGASPLATPGPQFPAMAQLAGSGQVAGALPGAAAGGGSLAAGRGGLNWQAGWEALVQAFVPFGSDIYPVEDDGIIYATVPEWLTPGGGGAKGAKLFKNAISFFKNTKFTNVGRALTKHPDVLGFSNTESLMQLLRNPASINQAGAEILKTMMRYGTQTISYAPRLGQKVVQYRFANGFGARFTMGGKFIGFITP